MRASKCGAITLEIKDTLAHDLTHRSHERFGRLHLTPLPTSGGALPRNFLRKASCNLSNQRARCASNLCAPHERNHIVVLLVEDDLHKGGVRVRGRVSLQLLCHIDAARVALDDEERNDPRALLSLGAGLFLLILLLLTIATVTTGRRRRRRRWSRSGEEREPLLHRTHLLHIRVLYHNRARIVIVFVRID